MHKMYKYEHNNSKLLDFVPDCAKNPVNDHLICICLCYGPGSKTCWMIDVKSKNAKQHMVKINRKYAATFLALKQHMVKINRKYAATFLALTDSDTGLSQYQ